MGKRLHCWAGRDCPGNLTHGACYGCDHPDCCFLLPGGHDGTCMLERDHEGPHEWTLDTNIGISFPPHDPDEGGGGPA